MGDGALVAVGNVIPPGTDEKLFSEGEEGSFFGLISLLTFPLGIGGGTLNPPHFFVRGEGCTTGLGKARGGSLNLLEEVVDLGDAVNLLEVVLRGEDSGVEGGKTVWGDG
jgi:hypothetical protein